MDRLQLQLRLAEILELPAGSLVGTESLSALENWDSLSVMSFIALANEANGTVLSPRQIASSETINDLLDLVTGRAA